MIFLNIGEPDFTAPPLVQEAAERAIRDGARSTPRPPACPPCASASAAGTTALRPDDAGRASCHRRRVGRAATGLPGADRAGDEVLMPDPSYPCNRQFVSAAEGKAVLIPTTAAERFPAQRRQGGSRPGAPRTRGVLLASPSNPTGTSIHPDELRASTRWCRPRRHHADRRDLPGAELRRHLRHSALAWTTTVISINSFSKYFNMTGWRLGWLVVPEALVPVIERLAQNLFICPAPSPSTRRWPASRPTACRIRTPARRVQGAARLLGAGAQRLGLTCR
jgi:aspartate/methionine/tyrosine aminotransferase